MVQNGGKMLRKGVGDKQVSFLFHKSECKFHLNFLPLRMYIVWILLQRTPLLVSVIIKSSSLFNVVNSFLWNTKRQTLNFSCSIKLAFSNVNNLHYILRLKSNLAVICTDSQMVKSLKCISMILERNVWHDKSILPTKTF